MLPDDWPETDDRARFARLYESCGQRLTRLAARLLGRGPRAEDAVHDAFVKFIRSYERLRDRSDSQLERWLMSVVRTTALDMLRRERREMELAPQLLEPALPPDQGGFEALVTLIRRLPEEYRQVLELRFAAEWSLAEIAEELSLPEGTVKSRIFRGRRLLMDALREEGYLDERDHI